MKNLEIKVQINSIDVILDDLSFLEEPVVLQQRDTYYLTGSFQIKLREEGAHSELIIYVRPITERSKESKYLRINVLNFLRPILKKGLFFVFGEKIVVNKKRVLFIYKNTRIHLDTVEGLGNFVELETVFNTSLSQNKGIKEHDEVVKLLNLHRFPVIKGSYSGLLKTKII